MIVRYTDVLVTIWKVIEIFILSPLLLWQLCRRKIRVKNKHVQFSTVYKVHRTKILLKSYPEKLYCHGVSFTFPCPTANKYVENMCEDVIREMRRCCETHSGKSVCCSGFNDPKSEENQNNRKG